MQIRPFRLEDAESVIALWQETGLTRPWNDPRRDIARKLTVQPELFFVADDANGQVVGTVMAGYDGHRGWMNYLAAHPDAQGLGIGRALVDHVEQRLHALGCPKVSLQVRSDNARVVEFYQHLGYQIDDTVTLGRRLITDEPPAG